MAEKVDASILVHQIPGGMFSNLISQLREQKALHRLEEVLEEVPRVRKDLGYPPLVTPTSQLVGTQAVLNVISGRRYSIVPKEVKDYVKGFYGRSPAPIDEKIKKKIIGDEEVITCRPADLLEPAFGKVPPEVKPLIASEEDLLTYALFPKAAEEFFNRRALERKEGSRPPLTPERQELEEVAAISTAILAHLVRPQKASAVIPARRSKRSSAWSMAGRQELMRSGSY
jgi:pyruvate/oxaloacetate carboxyltransferase